MKFVIALLCASAVYGNGGTTTSCTDDPGLGGACTKNDECDTGSKCAYANLDFKLDEVKKNIKDA